MGFLDKTQTQKKSENLGKIPLFCYPFTIMGTTEKSGKKSGQKFHCQKCDYTSRDKYDWNRHVSTRKHKMDNMDNSKDKKKVGYHCMLCGRTYVFASGLSKHKRKCHPSSDVVGTKGAAAKKTPTGVVKNSIIIPTNEKISKDRDEEKESLKKEVKELRQMMEKMIQAQSETNKCFHKTLDNMIGKVGNNTYNNKMSINVYLNEYCKNAMNLTDFVDKLKVSLEDLMYTKDHGYVKGISNIFVKQLQDMKPTERPIHCSDKKRLQFYVKDENKWEKDKVHSKIDKSIDEITIKQIKQIKLWENEHPNYLQNDKLLEQWHTMIQHAMGGGGENKRVKNKDSIKKELGITLEVKKELDCK